jgi:predicted DNA-binding transcriptional regulator YafY
MRRIERLINLIAALLEARRPMTAEDIRQSIAGYEQSSREAFRRSFERDKEALRAMGIPLVLTSDPATGTDAYHIPKSLYYLPELDLEPDELAALRIAADAILGSAETVRAGMMKLAADSDLPTSSAPSAGGRIAWGADIAAEQPLLGPMYTAVLERNVLNFDYQRAGSDTAEARRVEPYSLVHRGGHWYLIGRDQDRDAVRSFKVSRVRAALETTTGNYEVPPEFDAAAHLGGEAWEVGPEDIGGATVRFSESLRWWAEQNFSEARSHEGADGSLDVELPVANIDALISWVIGFGGEVMIVSPSQARERMLEHLSPYTDGTR